MNSILDNLNEEQLKPVLDTDGSVLVLAGAGSGKTRVLTSRIAHLICDKGVFSSSILAITFTNKAAREMRERIERFADCRYMWVSTIHSMCTRILREDIDKLGFNKNFTIFADDEKKRTIKSIFSEKEIDDDKLLKSCMWAISDAKNRDIDVKRFMVNYGDMTGAETVLEVFEEYQDTLKRTNCLDFDDLLATVYHLFLSYPEVKDKYAEKFKYIHVDEFQDTNTIQFKTICMLASKHGNIFVVGDDDQSIYGWRGADIRNILDFKNVFKDTRIYKLERNYRSTKNILNAANTLIKNNCNRMEKELWTENDDGKVLTYYSAIDELQEAYYIVNQIKSLVSLEGYKYSDFAVLMRVNALSRNIEQEFIKYNLPYKMFGGFKFFERKEIKDVIAYIRLLVNPLDEDAILRVINLPKRGIGNAVIDALMNYSRVSGCSLINAILNIDDSNLSQAQKNKIAVFRDIYKTLCDKQAELPLAKFIEELVKISGIYGIYSGIDEESIEKRMNLEQFCISAAEYAAQNESVLLADTIEQSEVPDLVKFLESITLSADIDSQNSGDNLATLATIHAVKGLEFKVVFIVGLEDGIFPLSRSNTSISEMEEERRLMYVAITRAMSKLYISCAESRYVYGKREGTRCSRFVNELGLNRPKAQPKYYGTTQTISSSAAMSRPINSKMPEKDLSKCIVGAVIMHKVFGDGVIISTNLGDNPMIDVLFKGVGKKTLAINLAPIEFK